MTTSIESFLAPVAGADPAGPDPRTLAAYQNVRDEVARLESPTAGACRWDVVEREAGSVLRVSKDLGSAAYLAGALAHRNGLEGLVLGTSLLAGLLGRYEALHPARPRARAGALAWYLERVEILAAEARPSGSDRERVLAWKDALASLDGAARARLGADAPPMARVKEAAERLAMSVPASAPPAATAVAAAPPASPPPPATFTETATHTAPGATSSAVHDAPPSAATSAPPSTDSAPTTPPAGLPRVAEAPSDPTRVAGYLTQLGAGLLDAARARRTAGALDPEALRLLLAGLFLPVGRAPASGAMPPPSTTLRAELAGLSAVRDPARAVEIAASAVERQRFWLDAHHGLSRALESAAPALATVHASELRAVLVRMPELLDRAFSDGSPFATAEARAWASALAGPPGDRASAPDDAPTTILRAAREALGAGHARAALAEAQRAVHLAGNARARFEARLELAQLALDAKSGPVALAVSADLLREASARGIAEWEPELEARACALYLRAATGEKSALPLPLAEVHARLCRVDPGAAIGIARS